MTRFSRRTIISGSALVAMSAILNHSPISASQTPSDSDTEPQLPATIIDANGDEITIEDISRIVPLSGDIAEITWDLGLGANIVGVDFSAVYPPELQELPKIGVERNLNAEGILSLEPTVVIGKEAAGPPPVLEQVSGAGVPVVIITEPQSIDAPVAKIQQTAAAFGVVDAGETLAQQVQSEIDEATTLAGQSSSVPTAMVIYLQEGGIQLVAGGETVASAMLLAAGARDVALETGVFGYQPLTAEAIVAASPEIIVTQTLGLRSVGGMEGVLEIPGIAETPAAQNARIFVYDDELLLGMTPRTGQQLMQMVLDFHPDLGELAPAVSPEGTPES